MMRVTFVASIRWPSDSPESVYCLKGGNASPWTSRYHFFSIIGQTYRSCSPRAMRERLARALEDHGLRPGAFYDVDRKKRIARGRPVLAEGDLPAPGKELMVCAVGAAGAREEIRTMLESHGYGEGEDFLFAA